MGFFDALSRIVQGKLVFDVPKPIEHKKSAKSDLDEDLGIDQDTAEVLERYDKSGHKIVPNVHVTRCMSHVNGDEMELWAYVKNDSDRDVELEKIEVLNITRMIKHFLRPHQEIEILLYKGDCPVNDHEHTAHLHYQQTTYNDYFCADLSVKYKTEHDNKYSISELETIRPIKEL